jgi:hypothetical protein
MRLPELPYFFQDLSRSGAVIGTAYDAAPEQAAGENGLTNTAVFAPSRNNCDFNRSGRRMVKEDDCRCRYCSRDLGRPADALM